MVDAISGITISAPAKKRVSKGSICSARNCKNYTYERKDLSFFRFPSQEERCLKWAINGRLGHLVNNGKLIKPAKQLQRSNKLCSDHFDHSQFTNADLNRLKWNAVPTLFDGATTPHEVTEKTRKQLADLYSQQLSKYKLSEPAEALVLLSASTSFMRNRAPASTVVSVSTKENSSIQAPASTSDNSLTSIVVPVTTEGNSLIPTEAPVSTECISLTSTEAPVATTSNSITSTETPASSKHNSWASTGAPVTTCIRGHLLTSTMSRVIVDANDHSLISTEAPVIAKDVLLMSAKLPTGTATSNGQLTLQQKGNIAKPAKGPVALDFKKEKMALRICELKRRVKRLNSQCKRMQRKIELQKGRKPTKKDCIQSVSHHLSGDAFSFVKSQIDLASRSLCGRRWTEFDKSFALSIYDASPKAYKLLASVFCLPSTTTLKKEIANSKIPEIAEIPEVIEISEVAEIPEMAEMQEVVIWDGIDSNTMV